MKKIFTIGIVSVLVVGFAGSVLAKSLDDYTSEIVDLNYQKNIRKL